MTTRRDFQLGQTKNFSLQADTVIEFVDGGAFTDLKAVHQGPFSGPAGSGNEVRNPPVSRFCKVTAPFIISTRRRPTIIPSSLRSVFPARGVSSGSNTRDISFMAAPS